MTNLALIISALCFLLAGLVGTYYGYKTFKLYLALVAFVAGFYFGVNLLGINHEYAVLLGLILGLLAAVLSYFVYKFALFFVLTFLGAIVGNLFLQAGGGAQELSTFSPISIVIGVVLGLVLSILDIDKPLVAIATALVGSYYMVIGVAIVTEMFGLTHIATTGISLGSLPHLNQLSGQVMQLITSNLFFALLFGFFAISGIFFQLKKWLAH